MDSIVYIACGDKRSFDRFAAEIAAVGRETVQAWPLQALRRDRRMAGAPSCAVIDSRSASDQAWGEILAALGDDTLPPAVVVAEKPPVTRVVAAMKAGAADVLDFPWKRGALASAVEGAVAQSRARIARAASLAAMRGREARLTRREHEVFERIVRGMMNKQIALDLGISERTVKIHRGNVMSKMDALSVAELARVASALGLRIGD